MWQVGTAFILTAGKSRTFQWEEIRKVDGNFDNAVNLYLLDGTKVLTARLGMVNYDVFCDMIKKTCPEKIASYYRSHMYEEPQKCILRYGSEYYLLAAMGIGILLIYMATLVPAAAENSIMQQVRALVCTCLRSHQYRVPGRDAQYKYPVFTGKNDHQIPTAQKT